MSNLTSVPKQVSQPVSAAGLRLKANVTPAVETKTEVTTVPVRKPSKQAFVRVHPDEGFADCFMLLQLEGENEVWAVPPDMQDALALECKAVRLYTSIDSSGNVFLWPIPMPDPLHPNQWHVSHHETAQTARSKWLRMRTNRVLGAYIWDVAKGSLPEPKWPEGMTYDDLLNKAFAGRIIDSLDHEIVKRLRGLVQ